MDDSRRDPASEGVFDRRRFLIGGPLVATAGAAWALEPRRRLDVLGKHKLEDLLPDRIGPWSFYSKSGLVVPPSDQLSQQIYSQLLTRVYVAPGSLPIMILVAQSASQTGILQVHRPEICYPAGGYQLARPAAEITLLDVVRIFEDPEERVMCPFGPHWCGVGPKCPLHETFSEMQQQALQRLALESFAQFEKSAG